MLLRQLFESTKKTAVIAFGRLNPPTIGHAKLVDAITAQPGDHFLFLSHTTKPKTDPLDFATKLKFAKQFFPNISIGDEGVRTPVQALEKMQKLGYTDVIFVAGSDRVEGFQKLFDTYNGKPDKSGNIPFQFNSINVISAGERDPDADGAEGMSASKMRAAAVAGDIDSFSQGVPNAKLAKPMYDAVRQGMGITERAAKGTNEMAAYKGNIGFEELMKFFNTAQKNGDTDIIGKVKQLISSKTPETDLQAWKIIQKYTGTKLVGKQFAYESIMEMIADADAANKLRGSRGRN